MFLSLRLSYLSIIPHIISMGTSSEAFLPEVDEIYLLPTACPMALAQELPPGSGNGTYR